MNNHYLHFKVNKKGSKPIALESFCELFFKNKGYQQCCTDLLKDVAESKDGLLLNDFSKKHLKKSKDDITGKYYAMTMSHVWQCLLNADIIRRNRRGSPAKLSYGFCKFLDLISSYWRDYVTYYKKGSVS